jgi:hypothetical protein
MSTLQTYTRRPKPLTPFVPLTNPTDHQDPSQLTFSAPPSLPPDQPPLHPHPSLTDQPSQPTSNATLLHRSSRHTVPPAKLHDYFCSNIYSHQSASLLPGLTKGTRYPLANFVSFHRYTPANQSFVTQLHTVTEPKSYSEVVAHPAWQEAMHTELQAIQENGTWSLTPLSAGKTPISGRWVYKIKHRFDGSIERYKARLVAKGFTQLEGVDFHDTFSPMAKIISVCCLFALAASCGWSLHQMDVYNAFLHGDLAEEIYMSPPQGLRRQGENHLVCRLHKSLYGLK